jgi:tetratricopeptide (TPR) repeat protein
LEQPRSDRAAFLDAACDGNRNLRDDVAALLAEHETSQGFLESPALGAAVDLSVLAEAAPGTPLPSRIGRYEIKGLLGEGGMGVVYLAEQPAPHRLVALKVMRRGNMTPEVLRRFALEAEVLGRLQHPAIAQIHEAGWADGDAGPEPFLAMEWVEGFPLLEAAERLRLDLHGKVKLLASVCDAVQHAHQKGVIHRDLKPANILVTLEGLPKILDFGVARLLEATEGSATAATEEGRLVGTLAYMAPEQVSGADIDTRCDVHALGVIGYELLSGMRPYEVEGKPPAEALRILRDEEPVSLATQMPGFKGDLDTIIGKALHSDRERRYGSASALAEDLRRFLRHEPILARPPSAVYVLRRFARRHRALVAAVAAIFVIFILGVATTGWQAARAVRERDRARNAEFLAERRLAESEEDRETAVTVTYFLTRLLAAASPGEDGRDVTVREMLEKASEGVAAAFAGKPAVEAGVREALGTCWMSLGRPADALPHFEAEVRLRREAQGPRDRRTLKSMTNLAVALKNLGRLDEAESQCREALGGQRQVLGTDHEDTLTTMANLATLLAESGKPDEAFKLYRDVEVVLADKVRSEHEERLLWATRRHAASMLVENGRAGEAQGVLREIWDVQRRQLGDHHPDTLGTLNDLAVALRSSGRLEEARTLVERALSRLRLAFDDEHDSILVMESNLAEVQAALGESADAEALLLRVHEGFMRSRGPEAPRTRKAAQALAAFYERSGRLSEAARWRKQD